MSRNLVPLIVGFICLITSLQAQPTLNISSASGNNGETVDINLTVDDYTNYISLEFELIYDPSVIQFQAVSNLTTGLPGFTASSSINVVDNDPSQTDTLIVSWFETNVEPQTLPDGTNIFTITFEVTGDPCDNSVIDIPSVEIVDENEVEAATIINPGAVNVPGVDCGSFDGIRIIGETKTVSSGSPVCIKFTSEGFDNLLVASYVINFNPAVLDYTGIQNINWPELVSGSTYTDAEADAGRLRVVWSTSDAEPISLPDGTVLYELCFNAIGAGGQMSQIGYTSFGTTNLEFANGDQNILDFQGVPGKVNIEGELEGFALILPNVDADPGDEVCLSITINDFIDIIAVGGSINWDSTLLEFDHFEGFNLPGLQESVSGPEVPGNNAGQAQIAWIDPAVEGITLPNGTEILRICFNVIGECGDIADIVWSSTPTVLEIADVDGEIPFTTINGSVAICGGTIECGANVVNVDDICPGGEVGSIDINVFGDCAMPITYAWSNGASTQDLNNVGPGDYVVTISFDDNTLIVLDTITINVLTPIQVSANITHVTVGNDGAVNITVTGGEPGYTFVWSTTPPQTGEDITGLSAGNYTVTITDANGCSFVAGPFTVDDEEDCYTASVTNITCFGTATGAISISNIVGVPGPHTFLWQGPVSVPPVATIVNLIAGTYNLTITGSNGATCTGQFVIQQPPSAIVVVIDTTSETGAGNNGAIDLTVTGGGGGYTYLWSGNAPANGATTQDVSGLRAGTYIVTITDAFGCVITRTIQLRGNAPFIDLNGSSYNGSGVSCAGECDGEIFAVAGNVVGNVNYLWSNGGTGQIITGLCPGTYSVTATDGIGQTAVASFTLTEPNALLVQVQITCASEPGIADGSAQAQVSGGTAPYDYHWSNGSTSSTIQNVGPGGYRVTVTDDNACQVVQQLDICISGIECYQAITVITPNGDSKNDRFTINCIHDLPNRLSIYNRYGGLEFEMENYDNNWEGTDQDGNELSDGGYHWVLQVFTAGGGRTIHKGTVSLVRSLD